jgi:hypothetical protein
MRQVGLGRGEVHQGLDVPAQRRQHTFAAGELTGPADDDADHRLTVQVGREDRQRWGVAQVDHGAQLVRGMRDQLPIAVEHVAGLVGRVEDRSGEHGGADRVQPVTEAGDHPEVAAAAT